MSAPVEIDKVTVDNGWNNVEENESSEKFKRNVQPAWPASNWEQIQNTNEKEYQPYQGNRRLHNIQNKKYFLNSV